jgi:hypothetical protein
MSYGYLIVIQDNASDNYTYGVPEGADAPQVIFTSYEDAKAALHVAANKFEEFLPVAYKKAYPYDSVSFDDEIEAKSFAPLGWGIVHSEQETLRICIGLLRMPLN